MKTLLKLLPLFLCLSAFAQVPPFIRNRFTTNADVIINAGAGITITTNNGSNFTFSAGGVFNPTNATIFQSDTGGADTALTITNANVEADGNLNILAHNSSAASSSSIRDQYAIASTPAWVWNYQSNRVLLFRSTLGFIEVNHPSNSVNIGNMSGSVSIGTNRFQSGGANHGQIPGFPVLGVVQFNRTNDIFTLWHQGTNVAQFNSNGWPRLTFPPGTGPFVAFDSAGWLYPTSAPAGGGSTQMVTAAIGTLTLSNGATVLANGTIALGTGADVNLEDGLITFGSGAVEINGDANSIDFHVVSTDFGMSLTDSALDVGRSGGTDGVIRVWDVNSGMYINAVHPNLNGEAYVFGSQAGGLSSVILHSPNRIAFNVLNAAGRTSFGVSDFDTAGPFIVTNANGGFTAGTNNFRVDALGRVNGVKVYRALISQGGTSVPSAVVLENSLGVPVVFGRSAIGIYWVTNTGNLTVGKTFIGTPGRPLSSPAGGIVTIGMNHTNANWFQLITQFIDAPGGSASTADGLITNTPLEILVYP